MPIDTGKAKILLVDDESVIRVGLRSTLEGNGFQVVDAADYASGKKLLDSSISLALVDIVLKGKSGLELLSHIRRRQPDIPVIIMSGYADKANAMEALHRGAVDYLEKPIGGKVLLRAVKHGLSYRAFLVSDSNFRNLTDADFDALVVHRDFHFLYANPAAQKLFEAPDINAVLGQSVLDYVHPRFRNFARLSGRRVMRTNRAIPTSVIKAVTRSGKELDIEIVSTPIHFDGAPAVLTHLRHRNFQIS